MIPTVRISVAWQKQMCFYFKICLNCTLLNSVWPAGFGQADRSGWICARSLPSSQTGLEPSPLAALCQEQILHALPYANARCEQWTNIIARTCAARTSVSCMRKILRATNVQKQKLFLLNGNWVPNVLPLSILTATVLHVESLSIPKAEASTTLPKAPCPRVLPARGKQYQVNGTAAELPVPQVRSQAVSNVLAAGVEQHVWARIVIISGLPSLKKCVTDWNSGRLFYLQKVDIYFQEPKFSFL